MMALAVRTLTVLPSNRRTVRPSSCPQQIGHVLCDEIDQGRRGAERFGIRERAALHHRFGGKSDIPLARFSQRSHIRRHILRRLRGHGRISRLSCAGHRVCRSDVRARRHDGDVGGDGEDESRRRRAGAGRPDEHDDRCARRDHSRDDVAGRVEQPARRSQGDHDDIGVRGVRLRDRLVDVLGGDGMDDAVQFGDDRRGAFSRGLRRLGEMDRRPEAETDEHGGSIPRHAPNSTDLSASSPDNQVLPTAAVRTVAHSGRPLGSVLTAAFWPSSTEFRGSDIHSVQ